MVDENLGTLPERRQRNTAHGRGPDKIRDDAKERKKEKENSREGQQTTRLFVFILAPYSRSMT